MRPLGPSLGPAGVWLGDIAQLPADRERDAVVALEAAGYRSFWIAEGAVHKEAMAHAALLLGWTERAVVATGIANIWARDALAAANAAATLAEAYPGRFVLGLGAGHAELAAQRGRPDLKPVEAVAAYLDRMEATPYRGPAPPRPAPRVLAALAPAMLRLARDRADGAHPYLASPAHTAQARALLGPDRLLAPAQIVLLEPDPSTARSIAREQLEYYLRLGNYRRSLLRLGFDAADVERGGSDRLVDAMVAWGEPDVVVARVREHLSAGADHVAVHAIGPEPLAQLLELAPELTARR